MFHLLFNGLAANISESNAPAGIDQIGGGESLDVPRLGDFAFFAVEDVVPGYAVLITQLAEGFFVVVSIDAEQCEVVIFKTLNQRFFVRDFSLARASPEAPENEENYFSFVIGQRNRRAVDRSAGQGRS